MSCNTLYTKYAFISYSHRDMAVAKCLQKNLEAFRLPTYIHNYIEARNRYLRPIFSDESDLNTSIIGDELRQQLDESKFLILICSVNSASVSSRFYVPVDTILPVGFGTTRDVQVELMRDDTFAIFSGNVYDSDINPLPDVRVTVLGHRSVTDSESQFKIILPLAEQREELPITLECSGYRSIIREDETPG